MNRRGYKMSKGPIGIEQAIESVTVEAETLHDQSRRSVGFRVEYLIFAALVLLFAGYFVAYFVFGIDYETLKDLGYLGIFLIAMAGAATIVVPTPSNVAIFGAGTVLDPLAGIPAPLMVGLVAGLGDAIGEFSGYALGYAGTDMIKHQKVYATFEHWMQRRGMLTTFLLCTFPNPFFDLAGAAAGASRMPMGRFFIATLGGKIVKDLFLAYGGSFSIGLIEDIV